MLQAMTSSKNKIEIWFKAVNPLKGKNPFKITVSNKLPIKPRAPIKVPSIMNGIIILLKVAPTYCMI